MPRLFILDAMNLAYRAYHALLTRVTKTPEELERERAERPGSEPSPFRWEPLRNSRGEPTNAIYGFANTVLKIRREEQPDFWALAWDGPGPTQRHETFAEYKATRKPMPEDLLAQVDALEDVAAALGLPVLEVPGLEADDVMATLACRGARDGFDVVLVTSDKDLAQLVSDRIRLLSPVRRGDEYLWVGPAEVREKWGVDPEQTRDVLALMGDTIDNIPGVQGIGPKTATELVQKYGSLDGIYDHLAEIQKPSVREKLAAQRDRAFLSRDLVTVRQDCDLPVDWEQLRRGPLRREALLELARRYEMQRIEKIALTEGVDDVAPPPARAGGKRGGAATRSGRSAPEPAEDPLDAWAEPGGVTPPAPAPAPLTAIPVATARTGAATDVAAAPAAVASLGSPQGSLDLWSAPAGPPRATRLEQLRDRLHEVRARAIHGLAILPIGSSGDARTARLVGLALAARDGATAYVPVGHESGPNFTLDEVRGWLAPALGDASVGKTGEDLKRDAHLLANAGMPIGGLAFDAHVGSFLLDPEREHGLAPLARDLLGVAIAPPEETLAVGPRARATASASDPFDAAAVLEAAAATLFPLADALRAQLESRDQWRLYRQLEHPLIPVLFEMEQTGIRVDPGALREQSARAAVEIARLEAELYALAGERINLNSGPQLARVLFEVLGLEVGRRTKTGYSTDQAVLEELAEKHRFPAALLEYRALAKLQSTYLDALPLAIDARDGRVHTTFNPVGAATGRLSSSNPNLQNIPIRTAQGREIRRAFVAAPGHVLVGADYSQIELRIMAHLSEDPNLIAAFTSGEDVHANTARRIFGVTGALDPALRSRAKIVNFGVMYGMGARSLSAQMKIPLAEAQQFIASYFHVFAGVREYLDRQRAEARARGWVETVFGRRRWLPGLTSPNGAERSFAERVAVNAPIQGSAADLMKLAMIRVHRALKHLDPSARLLLQVHDELLVECAAEAAEAVAERVRVEMEGGHALRVPLEVSAGVGATWFDVH